jgi:hypothetical protein
MAVLSRHDAVHAGVIRHRPASLAVEVAHLRQTYGAMADVDDLSFSVENGEGRVPERTMDFLLGCGWRTRAERW